MCVSSVYCTTPHLDPLTEIDIAVVGDCEERDLVSVSVGRRSSDGGAAQSSKSGEGGQDESAQHVCRDGS